MDEQTADHPEGLPPPTAAKPAEAVEGAGNNAAAAPSLRRGPVAHHPVQAATSAAIGDPRLSVQQHLRDCTCGFFPAYPLVPFRCATGGSLPASALRPQLRWALALAARYGNAEVQDRLTYWGVREWRERHQALAQEADEATVMRLVLGVLPAENPMSADAERFVDKAVGGVRRKRAQLVAARSDPRESRRSPAASSGAYGADRYPCPETDAAVPRGDSESYARVGIDAKLVRKVLLLPNGLWSLLAAVHLKLVRAHLGIPPWSTWHEREGQLKTFVHEVVDAAIRAYLGQVAMGSVDAVGKRDELQPQVAAGLLGGLDSLDDLRGTRLPACFDPARVVDERIVIDGARTLLGDARKQWVLVAADLAHDTASAMSDPLRRWHSIFEDLAAELGRRRESRRESPEDPDRTDGQVEAWNVLAEYLHQRLKPSERGRLEKELCVEVPTGAAMDLRHTRKHYIPRMYRMKEFCKWMSDSGVRTGDVGAAEMARRLTAMGRDASRLVTRPGEARPGLPLAPAEIAVGSSHG